MVLTVQRFFFTEKRPIAEYSISNISSGDVHKLSIMTTHKIYKK